MVEDLVLRLVNIKVQIHYVKYLRDRYLITLAQ